MPQVQLSQGVIHYTDTGDGPVVVLVHGLLVNGTLWRDVVPLLTGHRVVVPDLPLGSHASAMRPDTDLSPAGLATLVDEFLAALDLSAVTLVGNDTGGAICQLVAADHPSRLARLVLTNCDAYDNFLPPAFRPLQLLPRIPGAMTLAAKSLRTRPMRAFFGLLASQPFPDDLYEGWVSPSADPGVRRDAGKVLAGITTSETQRAIAVLRSSELPTLLAWGTRDPFFSRKFAERLASDIPRARLEWIEGARTFVPLDAPSRLAELIAAHTSAENDVAAP
jgi:pimeloyl-ACP methyl ester carboxylesterase